MVIIKAQVYGFLCFLMIFISTPLLRAADLGLVIGPTLSVHNTALIGITSGVTYRGLPSDTFFMEVQLLSHFLYGPLNNFFGEAGVGSSNRNGFLLDGDGDGGSRKTSQSYSVFFRSYEINWFVLLNNQNGVYFGPGIGYGVASVTEKGQSNSVIGYKNPSKFFSADDIHYGALLLKYGKVWDDRVCEWQLSSLGGMIGGGLLCGILF